MSRTPPFPNSRRSTASLIFALSTISSLSPAALAARPPYPEVVQANLEKQLADRWSSGTLTAAQLQTEVHQALISNNPSTQQAALLALRPLGEKAAYAAADVATFLDNFNMGPGNYLGSGTQDPFGIMAARALVAIGPDGQPFLAAAALGDKPNARNSALAVAPDISDPALVNVLLKALHAKGLDRGQSDRALIHGIAKYPAKPIIAAFQDKDTAIRVICLQALQHTADPAAADTILNALNDAEPAVQAQAAEVLANSTPWLHDSRVVDPLLDILLKSPNQSVRASAAKTLSDYRGYRIVNTLIAALDNTDFTARSQAVTALVKIGDRSALPALINVMVDNPHGGGWVDSETRRLLPQLGIDQTSLQSIQYKGRPNFPALVPPGSPNEIEGIAADIKNFQQNAETPFTAVDANRIYPIAPFIALAADPRVPVRLTVMRILGAQGNPAGADALIQGLKDSDETVRANASQSLARSGRWLTDPRAIDPLIDLLAHSPDAQIRSAAAFTLGNYKEDKDDRVSKALIAALDDPSSEVRAGAATSLGKLATAAAIPKLIALTQDKQAAAGYIDIIAINSLGQIGGNDSLQALALLLRSDNPPLAALAQAIEKITHKSPDQFPPFQAAQPHATPTPR